MRNEGRYQQRVSALAANWRALALRGLVALLFGLVVLFWPKLVFAVLAILFGLYAAVDGAITSVPALPGPGPAEDSSPGRRGGGLVAILWPGLTANGLVYVIAGWAVVTGVLKILTAILLRAEVENGWLLAGSGALSALFSILLMVVARSDVPFLAPFIGGLRCGRRPGFDRLRLPIAVVEAMTYRGSRLPAFLGGSAYQTVPRHPPEADIP